MSATTRLRQVPQRGEGADRGVGAGDPFAESPASGNRWPLRESPLAGRATSRLERELCPRAPDPRSFETERCDRDENRPFQIDTFDEFGALGVAVDNDQVSICEEGLVVDDRAL